MVYSSNPFLQAARAGATRKGSRKSKGAGFAASPAGAHMRLARNCFALAKRHKVSGNSKKYWSLVKAGRSALSLARQEVRLFKLGRSIRRRSYAAHRAA